MSKTFVLTAAALSAALITATVTTPAEANTASPGFVTGGMFGHAYGSRYETRSVAKNRASQKRYSKRSTTKHYAKASHQKKASRSYGGASRSCLQPSARALLNRIESRFGPVHVVSTCRPGATVRGTGRPSKHRYGLAVDFRAPAGKKSQIVSWLRANHHSGGTMTYSNHGHIHVDIGQRFVKLGARG